MPKRSFYLTREQIGELRRAHDRCKDGPTRSRFQAVRLYGGGTSMERLEDLTGYAESTLRGWVQRYRQQGVAGLLDQRTGGNSAKLTPEQREQVAARLHAYTPRQLFGAQAQTPSGESWTVEDLQLAVRRWFGVTYHSRISYYNLLHECGLSYQRTARVFKSQRPREHAEFQEQVEKN